MERLQLERAFESAGSRETPRGLLCPRCSIPVRGGKPGKVPVPRNVCRHCCFSAAFGHPGNMEVRSCGQLVAAMIGRFIATVICVRVLW